MPALRLALLLGTPDGTLWFLNQEKMKAIQLDTHFSMSLFLQVFCMVSCLLLSPLLVEGISVGGKTDELVTEHLITEMKQSE